jgi:FimV-like protein
MPNGGSDHCGNCRHNRVNIGRTSTMEERLGPAFCMVRNFTVRSSWWTYCANHYVSDKTPIGPMFGDHNDGDRVPYHGEIYPRACTTVACSVCGAASKEKEGIEVSGEKLGVVQFCSSAHYVRWWKRMHPGETLKWDCDAQAQARPADAVQAKLELAAAYIGMKDLEGARAVLAEVLHEGDAAQQARARELLRRC